MLFLALNITWVFWTLNSWNNLVNNNFWYWYGYSENWLWNNWTNIENEEEEKTNTNPSPALPLSLMEGSKIEDVIFETENFKKLVLRLNNRFFEELEKAEILEKILEKDDLVSNLKEKYFDFLLELKKYENSETKKENIEKKLKNFLEKLEEYKNNLKEIWYFIKLENTTIYVPYFENKFLNKIINILNYKLKEVLKNKNTEKKVKISKLYSRYLLAFKLKIEVEKIIWNIFTTKYLNKLFLELE